MQTWNDSSDARETFPDLYWRIQDQPLGLHNLHPARTLLQIADTAKQGIFPNLFALSINLS